jgi:hypothetical protein
VYDVAHASGKPNKIITQNSIFTENGSGTSGGGMSILSGDLLVEDHNAFAQNIANIKKGGETQALNERSYNLSTSYLPYDRGESDSFDLDPERSAWWLESQFTDTVPSGSHILREVSAILYEIC